MTLTAGVGGSLLSVGSAAGVALMGQARGAYTFMCHLRWTLGHRPRLRRQHRRAPCCQPSPVLSRSVFLQRREEVRPVVRFGPGDNQRNQELEELAALRDAFVPVAGAGGTESRGGDRHALVG